MLSPAAEHTGQTAGCSGLNRQADIKANAAGRRSGGSGLLMARRSMSTERDERVAFDAQLGEPFDTTQIR